MGFGLVLIERNRDCLNVFRFYFLRKTEKPIDTFFDKRKVNDWPLKDTN